MSKLGSHVVYRVPEAHHTTTTKKPHGGEEEVHEGSIHHHQLREFAGLVTRCHEADAEAPKGERHPTYDIVIFPPGKGITDVSGVKEGKGAGEITIL